MVVISYCSRSPLYRQEKELQECRRNPFKPDVSYGAHSRALYAELSTDA